MCVISYISKNAFLLNGKYRNIFSNGRCLPYFNLIEEDIVPDPKILQRLKTELEELYDNK